jgi:hypothetical protein
MAGAAHVGFATGFDRLIRADLVRRVVIGALGRLHELTEDVIQPLVFEIALLLGNPFVQAEVRLNDEL